MREELSAKLRSQPLEAANLRRARRYVQFFSAARCDALEFFHYSEEDFELAYVHGMPSRTASHRLLAGESRIGARYALRPLCCPLPPLLTPDPERELAMPG